MNRVLAITTGTRGSHGFEAAALMHPPPDGPPRITRGSAAQIVYML
jgi:hypothetical protein